ncbi:hypothetical protein BY996DRAFT_6408639 [Phakopsora pachyrhizi]|nr:hypothetical protein BY996DRAFT_6408639 [Phakopsora pachyrhizi]
MANQSISSVVGLEVENPISLLTPDRDVSFENLDPDLEQYSSMQKVIVEYSVYIPSNGGIQATSIQFDVFITGYVSNDPELRKNCWFILKDNESFEKWKVSSGKHPKAEIGVKILTPNPKERLEKQKKIDLIRSMEPVPGEMTVGLATSHGLGNTTDARVKAVMSQLIEEYPINDKYSKESQDDLGGSRYSNLEQATVV